MICSKCGRDVLGGDGHDGCVAVMTLSDAQQLVERERAVRDRALEIHEQRCAPETAASIREIARAEIEGREPSLISPFARV